MALPIAKILNVAMMVGPKIKSWIYSDGKYNKSRVVILIIALVVITIGYIFIPHEMPYVIEALDQVSDIIGYDLQ